VTRRRWLAPEVVQTSEMDCGPACLKCLVDGLGGSVGYGRLREACQTDVDGTSVDTIEDVGAHLGLSCEQVLVPADHVLAPGLDHLPCLAVVRLPYGEPHFVVLWRRHGAMVQVMDPAFGRRWIGRRRVEAELYVHSMELPADEWRAWAASPAFGAPLVRRLRALGVPGAERLLDDARAEPGWRALATLDAVARMVGELVATGAVRRRRAAALVAGLFTEARSAADPLSIVPERWWMARLAAGDEAVVGEGSATLLVRGAVLVCARGHDARHAERSELPRELAAALDEPPPRPARALLGALGTRERAASFAIGAGLVLAALGLVVESLLLRALLDVGRSLRPAEQRLAALGALFVFLGALLALELPLAALVQRVARRIEIVLRLAFLAKLPRIDPRYFRTRPASDMAERAHAIHRLREVVVLAGHAWRALAEVVAVTAGLAWLAPDSAPLVLALAAACVIPPLCMQKPLIERDLRVRTHNGSLSRFYLDALLGIVPVATHGTEGALCREHEGLLVQWARAGRSAVAAAAGFTALHSLLVHGLGVWLVLAELARRPEPAGALLLVFWVMTLVWLAEPLGAAARACPTLRNVTLRLLEPLGAPEDGPGADEVATSSAGAGAAIEIEGVTLRSAGSDVLSGVDVSIAPGSHVAIVGESGAGKSSLCGLLLGTLRATSGLVRVDGEELCGASIAALRRRTAWIDPEVQLWNRSLALNVRYGATGSGGPGLGEVCEAADLHSLLPRLADGLQSTLGESGGLVSGGEGQRVRLARALTREDARLVILDEAFRGLDRDQRHTLLERARRHWSRATLLYVTHRIAEAQAFERVLVVREGRVVEDGVPADLERDGKSQFRRLLEHERSCDRTWEDPSWRRLRLEDGRLEERSRCARAI